MIKYLKLVLIIVIGLLLGLILHGIIEIMMIWVLTSWLPDLFLAISWNTWLWIHLIFTIIIEILGLALAFWIYRKRPSIGQ